MNLQAFQTKTLDGNNSYRDLVLYEHQKLTNICISLLSLNPRGKAKVVFRGVTKDYLTFRLPKDGKTIRESELLSRLFYFGDKAQHFVQKNEKLDSSEWLKSISDISPKSNGELFRKIKELSRKNNLRVSAFVRLHPDFFGFFADSKNRTRFSETLAKLGQGARDYYLSILHTAGKIGVSEKSLLKSTSEKYSVARGFAGRTSDHPFVLVAIARMAAIARGPSQMNILLTTQELPTLPMTSQIFSEQLELSIRGGLLPHNILGVIKPRERNIIINPHIFSRLNQEVNLAVRPLLIDQSEFEANLVGKTNYTRWYYTYDEDHYSPGGIT